MDVTGSLCFVSSVSPDYNICDYFNLVCVYFSIQICLGLVTDAVMF